MTENALTFRCCTRTLAQRSAALKPGSSRAGAGARYRPPSAGGLNLTWLSLRGKWMTSPLGAGWLACRWRVAPVPSPPPVRAKCAAAAAVESRLPFPAESYDPPRPAATAEAEHQCHRSCTAPRPRAADAVSAGAPRGHRGGGAGPRMSRRVSAAGREAGPAEPALLAPGESVNPGVTLMLAGAGRADARADATLRGPP